MVTVCDVGPRDGLQNESKILPAVTRAELINRVAATGVRRIEAVSFVHPASVPAMADAEEVVRGIDRLEGVVYAGLVLNERGYERFAAVDLDEAHIAFAVTETFNQRNQNATVDETIASAARIIERTRAISRRATATIGASFGCPFEGAVDPAVVLRRAEELVDRGIDEIVFADTIGVGVPAQVRGLVSHAKDLGVPVGVHLHNTRNTGYANAMAALESGATVLDASLGGMGGCPFAPQATGNIATEDLVYLLHGEGIPTGIDLDALVGIADWMEGVMDKPLPGQVHRAGVFEPVARGAEAA